MKTFLYLNNEYIADCNKKLDYFRKAASADSNILTSSPSNLTFKKLSDNIYKKIDDN